MTAPVLDLVRESGLIGPSDRVLALVSGGRDSVCLLDVLVRLRGPARVSVLHVDYGLRGEESGADAAAVRALAAELEVSCTVVAAPPPPASGNLQGWARDLRYGLALRHAGEGLIATGHTAADQAETVVYRLLASPGRRALLGMAPREGRLVRPLLALTREQTTAYCRERGLDWREDGSNASERFARNRVRHGILAAARSIHPAAEQNVLRTSEILRAEAEVLDAAVAAALGGQRTIELARLAELPAALARLVVIRLAEDAAGRPVGGVGGRLGELLGLAAAGGSAALDLGGGVRAVVEYGRLAFLAGGEPPPPAAVALPVPGAVAFGDWQVSCAVQVGGEDALALGAGDGGGFGILDAGRIGAGPLTVRAWRAGDRMRPLGFGGSRAVSDLFTDRRVPRRQRPRMPLLVCGEEIAWIPGIATGERYRVGAQTRRIIVLRAARS